LSAVTLNDKPVIEIPRNHQTSTPLTGRFHMVWVKTVPDGSAIKRSGISLSIKPQLKLRR
jgi:hypothetical protein